MWGTHDLGIRRGSPALDKRLHPYLDHLASFMPGRSPFGGFLTSLLSASATLLGYGESRSEGTGIAAPGLPCGISA